MKLKSFLTAGIFVIPFAASAEVVLHGPSNYDSASLTVTSVDTITSAELNGTDDIFINFTMNNTWAASGDGWVTLTMNTDGSSVGDFTAAGVGGFLTRMQADTGPNDYQLFSEGGTPQDTAASNNFAANDGESHAVRITLSGFSSNNAFTGIHTALFEVDEFATIFSTADASMTFDLDFGVTDNGLTLRLNTVGVMDVDDLTVTQVPEPGTYALIGGLLALGAVITRRRRRL